MTDSSEDEDLSRFRESVDNSFMQLFDPAASNKNKLDLVNVSGKCDHKQKSERYLEVAGHYNDVKVSKELQMKIGKKVSEIIDKNIKFIDVQNTGFKKQKIEGGVKLFKDSQDYLSCEDAKDTYTENHNNMSRKIKIKKRHIDEGIDQLQEQEKIKAVAVSGEYVKSKEELKCWKSRRKEKILKYRALGNVLTAIE